MSGVFSGVIQILVMIIAEYLRYRSGSEQDSKDYIQFVQIMDRKGLASVGMRRQASYQTERVAEMWKKEEAQSTDGF